MRNINAKITQKDKAELVGLLRQTAKTSNFEDLLEDLLTPAEINEIVARLQIVKRLSAGEAQREVCRDLHVGLATVGRGSRVLEEGTGALAKVVSWRPKAQRASIGP